MKISFGFLLCFVDIVRAELAHWPPPDPAIGLVRRADSPDNTAFHKTKVCVCEAETEEKVCESFHVYQENDLLRYVRQGAFIGECNKKRVWNDLVKENFILAFETFFLEDFSKLKESDFPGMEISAKWLQKCWLSTMFGGFLDIEAFTWEDYDEFCDDSEDIEDWPPEMALNCPISCWYLELQKNASGKKLKNSFKTKSPATKSPKANNASPPSRPGNSDKRVLDSEETSSMFTGYQRSLQASRKPNPSDLYKGIDRYAANDNLKVSSLSSKTSPSKVKTVVTKAAGVYRVVKWVRVLSPIGWVVILVEEVVFDDSTDTPALDLDPAEPLPPLPRNPCNDVRAACEYVCGASDALSRAEVAAPILPTFISEAGETLTKFCASCNGILAAGCGEFDEIAIYCAFLKNTFEFKSCPYFPEVCVPKALCCSPFERRCDDGDCVLSTEPCPGRFVCPNGAEESSCDDCFLDARPCSGGSAGNGATKCVGSLDPDCCPGAFQCPDGDFVEPGSCCEDADCEGNQECVLEFNCFASCRCPFNTIFNEISRECENAPDCEIQRCFGENEECIDTFEGFECECKRGFERNPSNECTDINECQTLAFACDSSSKCVNEIGKTPLNFDLGYRCETCPDGTAKDISTGGTSCVPVTEPPTDVPTFPPPTASPDTGAPTRQRRGGGRTSGVFGDPHLSTFDRLRFDCQAAGEFTMVKSLNDTTFEIQERFSSVAGQSDVCSQASVSTAIAIRETNLPTIQLSIPREVDPGTAELVIGCPVDLFVGSVLTTLSNGSGHPDIGVSLISSRTIIVRYYPTGVEVRATVGSSSIFGCFFRVQIFLPFDYRPGELIAGLLGKPNGIRNDDWVNSNGDSIAPPANDVESFFSPSYNYCVENWCNKNKTDSIFTYKPGESFEAVYKCDEDYASDVENAISQASSALSNLCQGNIPCLIDGICGSLTDASVALQDAAAIAADQEDTEPTPSDQPSLSPSSLPTDSASPTHLPSFEPTPVPTVKPSFGPTSPPSAAPSSGPAFIPSARPSVGPSTTLRPTEALRGKKKNATTKSPKSKSPKIEIRKTKVPNTKAPKVSGD